MNILFAASEMDPLARTGGLGDVIEALPAALAARGHEVSVVLPFYRAIRDQPGLKVTATGVKISVTIAGQPREAEILECTAPNGVQVFLVQRDEYFDFDGLYGGPDGRAFENNAERFIYFSRVVVELARRILPPPDVIHVHDWQTALIPVLVRERKLPFKTVLTIHNLAFQGSFWAYDFGLTNLPGHYFSAEGIEFYGNVNLLKGGLLFADALTTVSSRYAREIQTPEFGCGLDAVIRQQSSKLSGILNGADYGIWDPATDQLLPANYSPADLTGKRACRDALLARLGLAPNPTGPVYSMVSRLAAQKGIDLLLPVIDRLLADDARLVVLGTGDPAYERDLTIACKQHAGRFSYHSELDTELSHLIEGGADLSFIPSFYEPCGLTAMYGLKYGTLPIARATGGLHEIIQDIDLTNDTGTGFLFYDPTPEAFWDAILRARRHFADPAHWQELMRRAMERDFSWEKPVDRYEALYRTLARGRR